MWRKRQGRVCHFERKVSIVLRRAAALCLLIGLAGVGWLTQRYIAANPAPAQINVTDGEAVIFFASDRTQFAFPTGCATISWRVSGIRAVEINEHGVVGEGSRAICGDFARMRVTLADETERLFKIERSLLLPSAWQRLVVVALVLLVVGMAVWLGIGDWLKRSRLHQQTVTWLETVRAEGRGWLLPLAALMLIGVGVRLLYLNEPIRFDEANTYLLYASQPPEQFLADYHKANNHLFHTLLVHGVYSLLGNQPWVLRLPAFVAGVLMIPAAYVAGRALYNRSTGLITAALVTASMSLIAFSTNARGYTIIALFVLLLLALAARLRERQTLLGWVLYAVLAALGVYTNPVMIYPLVIIGLWLLAAFVIEQRGRDRWRSLGRLIATGLGAAGLGLALYWPVIENMGLASLTSNKTVRPLTWSSFFDRLPERLDSVWASWHTAVPLPVMVLLVIGVVLAVVFHRRLAAARHPLPLIVLAALVVAVGVLVQRIVGQPRTWLFLLPFYLLTAAAGLSLLVGRWRQPVQGGAGVASALGLTALVIASGAVADYTETGRYRAAEAAALYLEPMLQPDDRIVTIRSTAPLQYYFDQHQIIWVEEPDPNRLIFVVDRAGGLTVGRVLANQVLDEAAMSGFNPLERIWQHDDGAIYIMTRPTQTASAAYPGLTRLP